MRRLGLQGHAVCEGTRISIRPFCSGNPRRGCLRASASSRPEESDREHEASQSAWSHKETPAGAAKQHHQADQPHQIDGYPVADVHGTPSLDYSDVCVVDLHAAGHTPPGVAPASDPFTAADYGSCRYECDAEKGLIYGATVRFSDSAALRLRRRAVVMWNKVSFTTCRKGPSHGECSLLDRLNKDI